MRQAKLNRINRPRVSVKAPEMFTPADKVQFLAELKTWGEMMGFKAGWAAVQFRERFGGWPPWTIRDTAPAVNVGAEAMAYIDERKKLWTKERKKQRKAEVQALAEKGEMRQATLGGDWINLEDHRI